jgi:hypothetical protein
VGALPNDRQSENGEQICSSVAAAATERGSSSKLEDLQKRDRQTEVGISKDLLLVCAWENVVNLCGGLDEHNRGQLPQQALYDGVQQYPWHFEHN